MFKNPFSFEGRIRRTEYGISFIIYLFIYFIGLAIAGEGEEVGGIIFLILIIPLFWFICAQSAKRCHDLGNSGWYQLIPFYGLWLLFSDGESGANQYGDNPKNAVTGTSNSYQGGSVNGALGGYNNPGATGSYSGGYDGGHNNHSGTTQYTNTPSPTKSPENKDGYKNGDLYN
jgi:uncharacterized membrane protein YhaH (DUF805 family)